MRAVFVLLLSAALALAVCSISWTWWRVAVQGMNETRPRNG